MNRKGAKHNRKFPGKPASPPPKKLPNTRVIDPKALEQGVGRIFFTDKDGNTVYMGKTLGADIRIEILGITERDSKTIDVDET